MHHAANDTLETSMVFKDAETTALSHQLDTESKNVNGNNYNPIYVKNYNYNLEKWEKIVDDPKNNPYPDWVNKSDINYKFQYFESNDDNDPERREAAKEAYIQQMASYETRAQCMQDFYSPEDVRAKNYKSSPYVSMEIQARSDNYQKEQFANENERQYNHRNNIKTARGETYPTYTDDTTALKRPPYITRH